MNADRGADIALHVLMVAPITFRPNGRRRLLRAHTEAVTSHIWPLSEVERRERHRNNEGRLANILPTPTLPPPRIGSGTRAVDEWKREKEKWQTYKKERRAGRPNHRDYRDRSGSDSTINAPEPRRGSSESHCDTRAVQADNLPVNGG